MKTSQLILFAYLIIIINSTTGDESVEKCYKSVQESLIKLHEKITALQKISTQSTYPELTRETVNNINELIRRAKLINNNNKIIQNGGASETDKLIETANSSVDKTEKLLKEFGRFDELVRIILESSLTKRVELFVKSKKECSEADKKLNELSSLVKELLKDFNSFETYHKNVDLEFNDNLRDVNKTKTEVESLKLPANLFDELICKSKLTGLIESNIDDLKRNKKNLKVLIENLKGLLKRNRPDVSGLQRALEDFNKRVVVENERLEKIEIPEIYPENLKLLSSLAIPEVSLEEIRKNISKVEADIKNITNNTAKLKEINEFLKITVAKNKTDAVQKEMEDFNKLLDFFSELENLEPEIRRVTNVSEIVKNVKKHDKADLEPTD